MLKVKPFVYYTMFLYKKRNSGGLSLVFDLNAEFNELIQIESV
jgi:hypothetical protein